MIGSTGDDAGFTSLTDHHPMCLIVIQVRQHHDSTVETKGSVVAVARLERRESIVGWGKA